MASSFQTFQESNTQNWKWHMCRSFCRCVFSHFSVASFSDTVLHRDYATWRAQIQHVASAPPPVNTYTGHSPLSASMFLDTQNFPQGSDMAENERVGIPDNAARDIGDIIVEIDTTDSTASDISLASSPSSSLSDPEPDSVLATALTAFLGPVESGDVGGQARDLALSLDEALSKSDLSMIPCYLVDPSGEEHGRFLAIDLGGSTLRVAVIEIGQSEEKSSEQELEQEQEQPEPEQTEPEQPQSQPEPEQLQQEPGPEQLQPQPEPEQRNGSEPNGSEDHCESSRRSRVRIVHSRSWTVEGRHKHVDEAFFDWLAANACSVLAASRQESQPASFSQPLATGITWSFALEAAAPHRAKIAHMAKGYTLDARVAGRELGALVEAAMARRGVPVRVDAILNDSLAVYAAGRFFDPKTEAAMVLGTGFNVCCAVDVDDNLPAQKRLPGQKKVLYNAEASLFGCGLASALATCYDELVDARFGAELAFAPHLELDPQSGAMFQPCELLAAGRYVPELVRHVLVAMAQRREVFGAQKSIKPLQVAYSGMTGELVCLACESPGDDVVARALESHFQWAPRSVSRADVAAFRLVSRAVVRRAAYVIASAVAGFVLFLASHNGRFKHHTITIGYVGSVMEHFHTMRTAITELVNACEDVSALGVRVEFELVPESSLVGAAISAAYHGQTA
ncbi:putative hexokinase [Clavispora lusitaniae]|uniref:Hexokinase n=1 Tax=Clavispora lusitaniae TaxID=36911 RepID=A0AA91PX87_CLALS|nr:putative hexokinase [Clavispora lusitaniae]